MVSPGELEVVFFIFTESLALQAQLHKRIPYALTTLNTLIQDRLQPFDCATFLFRLSEPLLLADLWIGFYGDLTLYLILKPDLKIHKRML